MVSAAGGAWAGATTLATPALRLMLRRRAARGKEIAARLCERTGGGAADRPAGKLLWLHAASVGEMLSVLPLLPLVTAGRNILFTTGTVTSAKLLEQRLRESAAADWGARVTHRFVPLDVPRWVAAFLDRWRPDAACFVESEIWPNMLAACRARGIPLGLLNARMSARSARRWRLAGGLMQEILGGFRWIAAQSEADARRLRALGAKRVSVTGDLKLAAAPLPADAADLARLAALLGRRPAWLAASTHPGEEAVALDVHHRLLARCPELLTIVVPRHPERGEAVAKLLGDAPRRSLGQDPPAHAGCWVGDSLGELGLFYRLAPIVFLGKSLTSAGGQNPWEPARLGCAIAVGPDTGNFAAAVDRLLRAGGIGVVADAAGLAAWVDTMLAQPERRAGMGRAAAAAASAEQTHPAELAAMIGGLLA